MATIVVLITVNSYWRVKETGRRAKWAAQQELLAREAGDAGAGDAGAGDAGGDDASAE